MQRSGPLLLVALCVAACGGGRRAPSRDARPTTRKPAPFAIPAWLRTAALHGTVRDASGPVRGASVTLEQLVGEARQRRGRAQSDAKGTFAIKEVPPGAYALLCGKPGFATQRVVRWVLEGENQVPSFRLERSAVVTGRVVDERGRAVRGARVEARPGPGSPGVAVSATSDDKGRFVVDGLHGGAHALEASAEGHLPLVRQIRVPAREVKLRLVPFFELRGLVLGRGKGKAVVRIAGSGLWPARTAAVDRHGLFVIRVPAGVYELSAWEVSDSGVKASQVLAGLLVGPPAPPPVLLALVPGQRIEGVVHDDDRPIAGAVVSLGQGTLSALRNRAVTDARGGFRLDPVVLGSYQLGVWARGFLPLVAQEIAVPAVLPLKVALSRGSTLVGRVVDPEGRPFLGARVHVTYRAPRGGGLGPVGAVGELGVIPGPIPPIPPAGSQPEGMGIPLSVSVSDGSGFRLSGLRAGQLRVVAEHPGYVRALSGWLEVGEREERTIGPLVLRPAGRLSGRVLDERGLGLDAAQVTVTRADGSTLIVFTDGGGGYRFDGLLGRVVVEAQRRGYLPGGASLRLASGAERELDLALEPARGLVSGFVLDPSRLPIRGARVTARRGRHVVRARSDRTGFFQLAGVGAAVELTVEHPDYLPLRRRASPGEALELRLAYLGGFAVVVQDERTGQPVERYTLALAARGLRRTIQQARGRVVVNRVPPGPITVEVSAEGYAAARRTAELPAPTRPLEVTLDDLVVNLRRAGSIAGRVTDALGGPVVGARVEAAGITARTDADGSFALAGVPEGNHVVTVSDASKRVRSDPVVVRAGERSGPLRLELR